MSRTFPMLLLAILFLLLSGCRCCRLSNCFYNHLDDCSDFKAELECLYPPELDISRAGMCDWCASSANRAICPCRCNGTSCCVKPVFYPSKFTTAYRQKQLEEKSTRSKGDLPSEIGSQVIPGTESILPPSPEN